MKLMTMEEYRQVLLDLASSIHEICNEKGLVYVLQGGSLLGAVRHGGFIPWDDDFDIMMPRYDYEVLSENFEKWCSGNRFRMASPRLENTPYFFAKVYDSSTYVKQTYIADKHCLGAWVDIFPLDGYGAGGDDVRKRVLTAKRLNYLAITDPKTGSTPAIRLMKRLVTPLASHVVNPRKLVRMTDDYIRTQSAEPTARLATYTTAHSFVVTPVEYVFDRTLIRFEDRKFWAPRNYEEYLEIEFGKNWRTPIRGVDHMEDDARFFL